MGALDELVKNRPGALIHDRLVIVSCFDLKNSVSSPVLYTVPNFVEELLRPFKFARKQVPQIIFKTL